MKNIKHGEATSITSNTRELSTNIGYSTPRPSDNVLGSTLWVVQKVFS